MSRLPAAFLLGALALAACEPDAPDASSPAGGSSGASAGRVASNDSAGVIATGPTYEARARAAWSAARKVALTEATTRLGEPNGHAYLADVPGRFSGLPADAKVLDLSTDAALLGVLTGTDEKAAAEAVRATGARVLVLHSALRPTFDRTGQVLSRLYHHDHLEYFQLGAAEDGALTYLVTDGPLTMDKELARAAVGWVRDTISGRNPKPFPPLKSKRGRWQLVASIRGQGQELAFSLAEGDTIDRALAEVVTDLEAMHRRQREPLGFPRLSEHIDDLTIELHRITERARVVPRGEAELESLWEMGLDGAILLDRIGEKKQSGVWPGSVGATRSMTRADQFLRGIAKDFRFDSLRPWRDSDEVELELIRTQHWAELPDRSGVVEMVRGTTKVPMDFVTLTTTRESILYAGEWYLANLKPDGQVTYKFWPEENRYSNEYNHVRHTLATWNLWQAWTLDPRPEFLEGAIRAQKWTLRALGEKDGMAFLTHNGQTKLGSVVVALLGMIEVAKATNDHSLDELMRKFGKFVMFMQADSGTFRGYWNPRTGEFVNQVNDIVPGEAALSLVYLYEYFQDPQYLEPLPKFFAYYKPWYESRRDKAVPTAPWPAYTYANETRLELVQFGPWTVMAAAAYTRVKPDAKDVSDFGLEVARWMIDTYEFTEEKTPFPDYVGGYYKFEGELPAMQAFCYAEGTAAAYDMALRMDPARAPYFEKATRESVRFGMVMQHDGLDTRPFTRPEEVLGGIKYAMNEPKVRIDYVHHGLSAMYQWLMAARTDPNLPAIAKAEPDAATRDLLRLLDMPSFRGPDGKTRTSVPAMPNIDSYVPKMAGGTGPDEQAWRNASEQVSAADDDDAGGE